MVAVSVLHIIALVKYEFVAARFHNEENKHKNVLETMKETLKIGYASLPTDLMAFRFFCLPK